MSVASGPFAPAGLYGKIPAQGDFVRVRAAEPPARALAIWLEEGSEAAKRRGVKSGPRPVRFLFRPGGSTRALLGVMAGSRDKVGREFPLAVFTSADARELADAFPALPEAAGAFLEAAESVLAEAPGLAAQDLAGKLDALTVPEGAVIAERHAAARAQADREAAGDFLARTVGDPSAGQPLYAIHCARSGCAQVREREPAVARAVLDCPVRQGIDRWAWLEMAHRLLRWPAPPSFFWRAGEGERLLLSLGPPPSNLLGVLCGEPGAESRLWPLHTRVPAAVEAARKALGPEAAGRLENPQGSVADLLGAATA